MKAAANTKPYTPQTRTALEACYASPLQDCSDGISREHFLSESILNRLNRNKNLTVSGFSWQTAQEQVLPPNAIAANILCERHNSTLSPLDAMAVRLFEALSQKGTKEKAEKSLHLINGHDVERWLLKVLCGLAASGNLEPERAVDLDIPRSWLEILFSQREFPNGWGLYVCNQVGHKFGGPHGIAIKAISNLNHITGLGVEVCGYELVLSMSGFQERRFDNRSFVYRPFEFYANSPLFEKSIVFSWQGEFDGGTITSSIE